jgi:hypothetical protein
MCSRPRKPQRKPNPRAAEFAALDGEEAGEDHRLDRAVAFERRLGRPGGVGHRVPDAAIGDRLQARGQVADLAGAEQVDGGHTRAEDAQLEQVGGDSGLHHPHPLVGTQGAVDQPDVGDDPLVSVVVGVEDHRPRRRFGVPGRGGHQAHDRFQDLFRAHPGLGRGADALVGGEADHALDLLRHHLGLGAGQVDLVDHRDERQVVLERLVGVGQGLGLDSLSGVHHQQGALAGGEGPGDLVAEVDVARRVDQIELVGVAVVCGVEHAHRFGLDGDSLLPLQVHLVEDLLLELASGDGAGVLQEAIGQRRLAVVDVGDDAEVTDVGSRAHS